MTKGWGMVVNVNVKETPVKRRLRGRLEEGWRLAEGRGRAHGAKRLCAAAKTRPSADGVVLSLRQTQKYVTTPRPMLSASWPQETVRKDPNRWPPAPPVVCTRTRTSVR
jgi:hypothetical protein